MRVIVHFCEVLLLSRPTRLYSLVSLIYVLKSASIKMPDAGMIDVPENDIKFLFIYLSKIVLKTDCIILGFVTKSTPNIIALEKPVIPVILGLLTYVSASMVFYNIIRKEILILYKCETFHGENCPIFAALGMPFFRAEKKGKHLECDPHFELSSKGHLFFIFKEWRVFL